jgi:hypothetical protein
MHLPLHCTAQEFIVSKKKVELIEKVKELYYKDQKWRRTMAALEKTECQNIDGENTSKSARKSAWRALYFMQISLKNLMKLTR